MKISVLGLLFLFLLSSCGVEEKFKPHESFSSTRYSNKPILLQKKSAACEEKKFSRNNSSFGFYIFQSGRRLFRRSNFFQFLSKKFLRDGDVIHRSVYDEKIDVLSTGFGEKLLEENFGSDIFVCPEESYENESVEGAALSATHFIEKTKRFFEKASPGIHISPVRLSISPTILKSQLMRNSDGSISKVSSYMTDNAYYRTSSRTIAFLPHSQHFRSFSHVNLWEVPMVASHEYGHHLFQEILGRSNFPPDLEMSCFGKVVLEKSHLKSIRHRNVKIDDVLRAFNEGFADLVAFYSLDSSERSVAGVPCLEISRDVVSPVFYDGNPKELSEEAVRTFFSFRAMGPYSCEVTNYQDVHTMGAIQAHTFNKFLSEFTISDEEKLAALIEWVKFLRSESQHFRNKQPEDFMKDSYGAFLKISVAKFNRTFDENICRKVEEIFPGLKLSDCLH